MTRRLPALALSFLAALHAVAADSAWQPLFDGKSLAGWAPVGPSGGDPSAPAVVADGAIACGPRTHLVYTGPVRNALFKNFELRAKVLTSGDAALRVWFHTGPPAAASAQRGHYVLVNNRYPAAGRPAVPMTGSLPGIRNQYRTVAPDGEWFDLAIAVRGQRILVRVNDTLVTDYVEPAKPARRGLHDLVGRVLSAGTFALAGEAPAGAAPAPGTVKVRDLAVKVLPDDLPPDADAPVPAEEPCPQLLALYAAGFPVMDLHAHLKGGLSLEDVTARSRATGIFYGIAVNGGIGFPINDDAGVEAFARAMAGKPTFVAMQAEGREWVKTFSKKAAGKFDYVFTDSMTYTDDKGRRMRLWIDKEVWVDDKQAFMETLVRRIEGIMAEPIDIYVNPTFLPKVIAPEYDQLWTKERMERVVAAAKKHDVAVEINARYRIPSATFIKMAKAAGLKFTFGTNNTGAEDLGNLEYCQEMIKECALTPADLYTPRPGGAKAGR